MIRRFLREILKNFVVFEGRNAQGGRKRGGSPARDTVPAKKKAAD